MCGAVLSPVSLRAGGGARVNVSIDLHQGRLPEGAGCSQSLASFKKEFEDPDGNFDRNQ